MLHYATDFVLFKQLIYDIYFTFYDYFRNF